MKLKNYAQKEYLTYLLLWVMLFALPVINEAWELYSGKTGAQGIAWFEVLRVWKMFGIFLVIFIIHDHFLAPLLIHKGKRLFYVISIFVMSCCFLAYRHAHRPKMPHEQLHSGMKPPLKSERTREHAFKPERKPQPHKGKPMPFEHPNAATLTLLLFILSFNLGVKSYWKTVAASKQMQQLKMQNLEHQLEYLKFQLNPHFFMNTLNNIHALIDINAPMAKTALMELSKMMRYVLYESDKKLVSLEKERVFLQNYLQLMRLRYDKDKLDIRMTSENLPDKGIPPLILITFVENAFKHGVSYKQPSYIHIAMEAEAERLTFRCSNSQTGEKEAQNGGIGLENVRKRLNLIFEDKYSLEIDNTEEHYSVVLDIPLQKYHSKENIQDKQNHD